MTSSQDHLLARPMSSEQDSREDAVFPSARAPRRLLGALALLMLMQLPWPRWLFPQESPPVQVLREGVYWLMAGLLVFYVLFVERRPLRSLGVVKPDWKSLAWGIGGAAATVAGLALCYLVIIPALGLPAQEQKIGELQALPLWFRLGLVTRAAVFEELLYRGFAIERMAELSGRRWIGALAALVLFTLAHIGYWGWSHLIVAACGGLVLTALYLLRRDLTSNVVAHWLTDAVAFLLT